VATLDCDFEPCVRAAKQSSSLFSHFVQVLAFIYGRVGVQSVGQGCRQTSVVHLGPTVLVDLAVELLLSGWGLDRERSSVFGTRWDGYLFLSMLYSDRRLCGTLSVCLVLGT
jgi:hypothetical protein